MVKPVEMGPEGARLGYVEFDGDGRALVFLHGLGACSPIYFALTAIEPVLAGRRALMIDFLGFGIRDRPAGFGYTLEDHARRAVHRVDLRPVRL
jgi:pimeloyl-ACP methyl ester carboxylesterase